jgi:hypothetical protein
LLDVLRLPRECSGAFVTGATVANFCALAAARHSVLMQAGWNSEADGLFGAPPITVIVSAEAHPSVTKSLGLLGLGRSRVIKIPVDDQGRMLADKLPAVSGPTIICVQAGNVNTGSFDPIAAICRAAHAAGAGSMSMARSVFGLLQHLPALISRKELPTPIPGRRTPTNGSTFPTIAAWLSSATKILSPPPWRLPPNICRPRPSTGTPAISHPSCRAAPAASKSGPRSVR